MPYEEVSASTEAGQEPNEVAVSGELDAARPRTLLRLPSGRTVVLPTEFLLGGMPRQPAPGVQATAPATDEAQREQVIPLLAEEAHFDKKTVTTGSVRVHRGTETFTDSVNLPITRTEWEIVRTPVGQLYTEKPEVWHDGDTTVYPLVEERIVAKREYFVVEEVRVRRVATTTERTATVELKRDVLTVERDGVAAGSDDLAAGSIIQG